ncbi:hypothetical protein SAMN06295943_0214 [Agreia sp. VKM Ac-1783]|nr:hypothetical protein SAMN06295943_0214 [Agreia sp. VKM Ac-1783]
MRTTLQAYAIARVNAIEPTESTVGSTWFRYAASGYSTNAVR